MKYIELKNKYQDKVDNFKGLIFAFTEQQLEEGLKKINATRRDITPIGLGGFVLKDRVHEFKQIHKNFKRELKEHIDNDPDGENFVKNMFLYELNNHEYIVSHDEEPALRALDLSYEDLKEEPKLKHGLECAMKDIMEREMREC